MMDVLAKSELFEGLDPDARSRICAVAERQSLSKGDYLFLLGDNADRLFVVLEGKIEVCFPLSVGGVVKDIAVEALEVGRAFGLSAVVRPHRFTFSARAAERAELATFARTSLQHLAKFEPRIGCDLMGRLVEVVGRRFLTMRALWAREVQRSISSGRPAASYSPDSK